MHWKCLSNSKIYHNSKQRVGNSLRQWALWMMKKVREGKIPEPPGRTKTKSKNQLAIPGWEK